MIADLKPYSAMKDSGVGWLGDMPEHWEAKRGKAFFHCVDVRSSTGEEELLTVSSEHGVVPRSSATVTMFKAESYVGYKLCWPGDLVINSLWAWGRGLGVSRHHGIISSAYGVYRLRSSYAEYSAYVHELVRSAPFNWELQVRSKGIWISRLQLTDEAFLGAPFPLPPSQEQAAIVRFLDHADRRIRRYIRAKQKLITLLEEQRQAIIHQAVTGQVDVRTGQPYPAYKPSGVEWLVDVPEDWVVKRFKFLARVANGQVDPRRPEYRGKILVAPNHIRIGTGEIVHLETADSQGADSGKYEVRRGQIIYSKIRPNLRKAAIAPLDCLCSADMYPIAVRETELRPTYLLLLLLSLPFTNYAVDCSLRVAMPKVNREALGGCWIWYPSLKAQDAILEFVESVGGPSGLAVAQAAHEISLLSEYRTRLIADVVTGKLDVREAAAGLPEVDPLAGEFDALTTQAAETGMMELGEATETPEELAMENEVTI